MYDDGDSLVSEWRQRLITNEDPMHLHKTLGILCLLSYAWRFSLRFLHGDVDMGFRQYPRCTLPTLALHLALNLSSFAFQIPSKRIQSGYRIWPEYRFHSLVFLCRSLAFIAFQWYDDTSRGHQDDDLSSNHNHHLRNLIIIMASVTAADLGSNMYSESSGFARNLQVHNGVKFFFSFLQLLATTGCLSVENNYSIHMVFCCIIQVNAFLMTLRRKNLVGQTALVSVYAGMLLVGWIIGDAEMASKGARAQAQLHLLGMMAALLRMSPRVLPRPWSLIHSKYFIWPFLYGVLQYQSRPDLVSSDQVPMSLIFANVSCFVATVALAIYKVNHGYHFKKKNI